MSEVFWSDGQITEDATGLSTGEYSVQIHTDLGCHTYKDYFVPAPTGIGVSGLVVNPPTCASPDGGFSFTTVGGNPPYGWVWSSGETTENISGKPSDVYTCTVTDEEGCVWAWSKDLKPSDGPKVKVHRIIRPTCGNLDGEIDIKASPGATTRSIIPMVFNISVT